MGGQSFTSPDISAAAVTGTNTSTPQVGVDGNSVGVEGQSDHGFGVFGHSIDGRGVVAHSDNNYGVRASSGTLSGIRSSSVQGIGVEGEGAITGVLGASTGIGVNGVSSAGGNGVQGISKNGVGVRGVSQEFIGGVIDGGIGVVGSGPSGGVFGRSDAGVAMEAESARNTALVATTNGKDVSAFIVNHRGTGNIIIGRDAREAEVFRVLQTGDVETRGVVLTSDRNAKTNFSEVDTRQILDNLACMQIPRWNYKTDPAGVNHVGPTSQDFQAAFGLNGGDDIHISAVDAQGIAFAAIKGLNEKLNAENATLRAHLARLEARIFCVESER
jgi:hypothetical protein